MPPLFDRMRTCHHIGSPACCMPGGRVTTTPPAGGERAKIALYTARSRSGCIESDSYIYSRLIAYQGPDSLASPGYWRECSCNSSMLSP
jgi:hypothetical protein